MKKLLLVLGMITCMLGMSACGSTQENITREDITEESLITYADQMVETFAVICSDPQYLSQKEEAMASDAVFANAITSWESAAADMGNYVEILDHKTEISADGASVVAEIKGENRNAKVEFVLEGKTGELQVTSITTSVVYTFGELMEKAALNTLLGMGTVFVVLILICLIISCFTFIPKIQAAFKKAPKEEVQPAAVDNTIAQIIEKEELSDDFELVAVIAAAIAASEGATSTDGFVVRSIRKRRTV